MNKKIYIGLISLLAIIMGFQTCVKKEFELPNRPTVPEGSVWSIQQIKDSALNADGGRYDFKEDLSLRGVITTSETNGNFYKKAYLQANDEKGNPQAIVLTMKYGSGITLVAGDSVRVALKGLTAVHDSKYGFSIETLEVDRNIYKQATGVEVKPLEVNDINELETLDGILVKVNNIQVAEGDLGKTFADAVGQTTQNINVQGYDADDNLTGVALIRTSGYANFADKVVPEGKGSLVAIASKFGSDKQLFITDYDLVKLTGKRVGSSEPNEADWTIAQVKEAHNGSSMTQITEAHTIEATVTASDENGNLYKRIYIQDATGGIQLNINDYDLFKTFPVGTKLQVNLKNLYVDLYGEYKIGVPYDDNGVQKLGGIPAGGIGTTIVKLDGTGEVAPAEINITGVTDNLVGSVVKVNNVQFIDGELGQPYAGSENTNRTLTDADGNELIVRTSSYAAFKAENLPQGSGSITAILTKFGTTYQLTIRDINEVDMTGARFTVNGGGNGGGNNNNLYNGTPIQGELTIAALKASYSGSGIQPISETKTIKATVVADDTNGNLYKGLYVEDATGGINIKINKTGLNAQFPVGTNVEIKVAGLSMDKYGEYKIGVPYESNGQTKLGGINPGDINTHITVLGSDNFLNFATLDLASIDEALVGSLVKVENIQFIDADLAKNYAESDEGGNRTLTNAAGQTIIVRTSNYSDIGKTKVAQGSGSIIAILTKFNTTYQLMIRDITEVEMEGPRF